MKTPILVCLSLAFVVLSCNNAQKNANQKIQEEMIVIHDEVMPHMTEFVKSSDEIDSILNNMTIVKMKNPELDTLKSRQELLTLKGNLVQAHDSMNDWMHELTLDFKDKSEEEVKSYLENELEAIKKIKDQFNAVMKEKQSVLDPIVK